MGTQLYELQKFLRSRRARLTPPDVGLPWPPGSRRVAGLRREEIAMVAGVSVCYYTRLEQGRFGNVSDQVLDAIATAMQLNDLERRHLFDLVKSSAAPAAPSAARVARARPELHMMVEALDPTPVVLHSICQNIIAINRMGKVLLDDFGAMPRAERNLARWMFLNPKARTVYPEWEKISEQMVAVLRVAVGQDANDPQLTKLVDDLSTGSPQFAKCWGSYCIFHHTFDVKRLHHPAVGTMTINQEALILPADPDLCLDVYTAAPGSPSAEKLEALSSWERTHPVSRG
jgi:transcriptional regulator with XRE-family HTH domain